MVREGIHGCYAAFTAGSAICRPLAGELYSDRQRKGGGPLWCARNTCGPSVPEWPVMLLPGTVWRAVAVRLATVAGLSEPARPRVIAAAAPAMAARASGGEGRAEAADMAAARGAVLIEVVVLDLTDDPFQAAAGDVRRTQGPGFGGDGREPDGGRQSRLGEPLTAAAEARLALGRAAGAGAEYLSCQGRVSGSGDPPAGIGEGDQFFPAQAAAGGGAGHQLVTVARRAAAGECLAELADVAVGQAACGPSAAGPSGTAITGAWFTGVLPSGLPGVRAGEADGRAVPAACEDGRLARGGASSCQLLVTDLILTSVNV